MKSKKIIDGTKYSIEVWIMPNLGGFYRFGAQAMPAKGNIVPFSMRLSEEFIEDEIDNERRKNYLVRVALRVVENHIEDILILNKHAAIGNLSPWFKEAKTQIDEGGEKA